MLSQSVWDQMLETEKEKVKVLEEKYAEKMRSNSVCQSLPFYFNTFKHSLIHSGYFYCASSSLHYFSEVLPIRGHPFMTSTQRGGGRSGSGGRMWTGGGGSSPMWTSAQN